MSSKRKHKKGKRIDKPAVKSGGEAPEEPSVNAPAAQPVGWRRHWHWVVFAIFALYVGSKLLPAQPKGQLDYITFGKLPVLMNGRVQPFDSVARNSLLQIRGTQTVPLDGFNRGGVWGDLNKLAAEQPQGMQLRSWWQFGKRPLKLHPSQWLLEVMFKPRAANDRYIFVIHHPQLLDQLKLGSLGVGKSGLRYYTFRQLAPHIANLAKQAGDISQIESQKRNPLQKAIINLVNAVRTYVMLRDACDINRYRQVPGTLTGEVQAIESQAFTDYQQFEAFIKSKEFPWFAWDSYFRDAADMRDDFLRQHNQDLDFENPMMRSGLPMRWTNNLAHWKSDPDKFRVTVEDVARYERAFDEFFNSKDYDWAKVTRYAVNYQMPYTRHSQENRLHIAPPLESKEDPDGWGGLGRAVLQSVERSEMHPSLTHLASIGDARAADNAVGFNKAVIGYRDWLAANGYQAELKKGREEHFFSHLAPFFTSWIIYIFAMIFGLLSWLNLSPRVNRAGYYLLALAFVLHTVGLIFRMYLEGRPPVTNLYSSAVFVGWGAAGLGLLLERVYRNGIGTVTAGMVGMITLYIAHILSLSGDTMEMMRAVLDTNFWLATHVVVITLGYAATFLAGFLAIIYILRGSLTQSLDADTAKSLSRMVYGIVCFATLFSFVGTVLGGIWADQSWGRFWGWDPKENGALMIVIWNAIILHCRWGGMVRDRGLMNLAVFGNIVTAYSWFGVNMIGVGLHFYGFMDSAMMTLSIFIVSQLVIMGVGFVPLKRWASGAHLETGKGAAA